MCNLPLLLPSQFTVLLTVQFFGHFDHDFPKQQFSIPSSINQSALLRKIPHKSIFLVFDTRLPLNTLASRVHQYCSSFRQVFLFIMSHSIDPTSSFPHADLTPIVGKPTFAAVQTLKKQLVANAVSVRSARGNGQLGHAVLVLGQAAYDNLAGAGNNWINPVNPGQAPVIPAGATQHQIIQAQAQFDRDTKEWETFNSTGDALKRQIIAAVDTTYIASLEDPLFGFTNVSVHDILHHLETTYAALDPDALTANMEALRAPWDPSETMEPLWQRGVNAQQMAQAGGNPITDGDLLLIFRDLLKSSGLFPLDIRDWDRLPAAQKTLANFKVVFTNANKERVANLTAGQQMLPTQVPARAFAAKQGAKQGNPPNPPTGPAIYCSPTGTWFGYCWSHGITTNPEHNSKTCNNKASGHQEDATIDNMMGGNNTIRRKPREKNVYIEKNPPKRTRDRANLAGSPPNVPPSSTNSSPSTDSTATNETP